MGEDTPSRSLKGHKVTMGRDQRMFSDCLKVDPKGASLTVASNLVSNTLL